MIVTDKWLLCLLARLLKLFFGPKVAFSSGRGLVILTDKWLLCLSAGLFKKKFGGQKWPFREFFKTNNHCRQVKLGYVDNDCAF